MYKSYKVTVTSDTPEKALVTPTWNYAGPANANVPVQVVIYNSSATYSVLLGGSSSTLCVFPLAPKTYLTIFITGNDKLFAHITGADAVTVYVLVGNQ